jgi:hypothetical protein
MRKAHSIVIAAGNRPHWIPRRHKHEVNLQSYLFQSLLVAPHSLSCGAHYYIMQSKSLGKKSSSLHP